MKKIFYMTLISAAALLASCSGGEADINKNPLVAEWDTPYGIPPFDKVQSQHYKPALLYAMDVARGEYAEIENNPDAATFENTIEAMENAGALLDRVSGVFYNENSINSTDSLRALATEMSPLFSQLSSEIALSEKLFARVKALYEKRDSLGLRADQMRLLEETYKSYLRNGANLDPQQKEELTKVNSEIASLQLKFGQNLLAETAAYTLNITEKSGLEGLTEGQIEEAAARAKAAGKEGWLFGLDNPSIMPFLENSANREYREQMLTAYLNRCNNNNENDNKEVIKRLVELRLQKAKILGYESCADFILSDRMAKTPEAVYDLLDQIWAPALKVAKSELADIQAMIRDEGGKFAPEAWDWRYYASKAKSKRFSIDESQLAPYFKLENVREGIFYVANKLYGLTFQQLENVPLPHPEAVCYKVSDKDSSVIGLVFFDMFARPGYKRGGAWCGGYRDEYYKDGKRVIPIVTIVGNFTRPIGDKPALLTTDEVETYFHEFGHGLAALMENVQYKGNGGFVRDFVELPSQLNEHWAFEPEVLKVYAKHYQTGEVIPQSLVERVQAAGKYGQGFATVEYLAASYLDMDFHVLKEIPADFDVMAFEDKVLSQRGILSQIPSRYRAPYFNHTFGGGYTAGYYSYIWAEVLDADAFEAFVESGDIFNREVAERYRYRILARGSEDDAMNLYIDFRGKRPGILPLLKNRGLN